MTRGQAAYRRAMEISGDLISHMREASGDPARTLTADIWANHDNVPFLTTVYEAVAEMRAATDPYPDSKR
jgi:hypothetical protein